MRYQLFDTVLLGRDLPGEGLRAGSRGTVILVFDEPELAYEVEFGDDKGRTVAQIVLRPGDLTLAPSNAGEVADRQG